MFLKKTLVILSKTNLCYVAGVKIIVTGRLNSAPRTKKSIILIGKVPLQTIERKIDFHQSVAYTSVGTIGIKVWINEN
jgi:small subunit ribosomal protein S3